LRFARNKLKEPWRLDDVEAWAGLLRGIRNYGIHPRSDAGGIESYLTEEGCGLLFVNAGSYLDRLSAILVELGTRVGAPFV